jgi:CheY-like chemotaxis protein
MVSPADAGPSGSRGRVLFVDDEPQLGILVEQALRSAHEVTPVASGREALHRIAAGERYDVILLDLMMPLRTGMELFGEIERIAPELCPRVIFLSGGAYTAAAQAFLARLPNPRLEKPFDHDELAALIAAQIDR